MIDRKRVRELARQKPPRSALIAFLERVEPLVQTIEPIMPESAAAMDTFRASRADYNRLERYAIDALVECTTHSEIIAMRRKTRGRISEEQRELSERLERVGRVFYRLLGQPIPPDGVIGGYDERKGSDRRREGRYRELPVKLPVVKLCSSIDTHLDGIDRDVAPVKLPKVKVHTIDMGL